MTQKNQNMMISYMNLRTLIGVLGMLLPVMCYIWCCAYNSGEVLDSISMHYYTNFRDVFVGILVSFSVFLITYKGYSLLDNVITVIIGITGIMTALFPCDNIQITEKVSFFMLDNAITGVLHYVSAGIFFSLIAYNSLFVFTKAGEPVQKKSRKYYRNILYRVTGVIIIIGLIGILITVVFTSREFMYSSRIILILETIMLLAFGISWFVKGGAMMGDLSN